MGVYRALERSLVFVRVAVHELDAFQGPELNMTPHASGDNGAVRAATCEGGGAELSLPGLRGRGDAAPTCLREHRVHQGNQEAGNPTYTPTRCAWPQLTCCSFSSSPQPPQAINPRCTL